MRESASYLDILSGLSAVSRIFFVAIQIEKTFQLFLILTSHVRNLIFFVSHKSLWTKKKNPDLFTAWFHEFTIPNLKSNEYLIILTNISVYLKINENSEFGKPSAKPWSHQSPKLQIHTVCWGWMLLEKKFDFKFKKNSLKKVIFIIEIISI